MSGTFIEFLTAIVYSRLFWTLVLTYVVAHVIKMIATRAHAGAWSARPLWATGGMPSSHTAITVAVTTAVAFETGPSPLFFASLIFALIVIRDSVGVRTSVGEQAKLLNTLAHRAKQKDRVPIVLGHTKKEVLAGLVLGILVPLLVYALI